MEEFRSYSAVLLQDCAATFEAAANEVIETNIRVGSPGVTITHDFQATPMTAKVTLHPSKIIGDLLQVFAAERIELLQTQLPRKTLVDSLVAKAITSHTKDACNEERLWIMEQYKQVREATTGIERIAAASAGSTKPRRAATTPREADSTSGAPAGHPDPGTPTPRLHLRRAPGGHPAFRQPAGRAPR